MTKLVHYCPGDAPGSPAWLSENQALRQRDRDTAFIEKIQQVGMRVNEWPHIGAVSTKAVQATHNR